MPHTINRTQLLRGDLRGDRTPVRPPWSIGETLFIEQCTRCDDCIGSCQQHIIRRGAGGFPQIDFSHGACTFCGDCVRACSDHALAFSHDAQQPPWTLAVEIKEDCLALNGIVCRSCGERCEEAAISFSLMTGGRAQPELDAERCSGCGECFSVCPTKSISIRPLQHEKAA